jgi:hypothetical protein
MLVVPRNFAFSTFSLQNEQIMRTARHSNRSCISSLIKFRGEEKMQTQHYSIVLRQKQTAATVNKQCKMCGKVVTFTDTTIRRHNANGKNIYQFAIYKCPKNHSWNQKLDIYKSFSEHVDPASIVATEFEAIALENEKISLNNNIHDMDIIEITISEVAGTFRLDRTLADQIEDVSRSAISQKIKEGKILLNNRVTKPSQRLSLHDKILIKVK